MTDRIPIAIIGGGVFDASFYVSALYKKAAGMHATPDMLMKSCRVVRIAANNDGFTLEIEQLRGDTKRWQLDCEVLINAAGLYALDIAKMLSPELPYEKQYLRGEYFQFNRRDDLSILGDNPALRILISSIQNPASPAIISCKDSK